MSGGKTIALGSTIVVCLALLAVPASAGVLNGHPDAYNDGQGPGADGAWTMTTPFDNLDNLSGTVDWAVFAPGDFPFDTGGDWAPTSGEMCYVYQLFSTGTDAVSSYTVPVFNPADNIGAFADLLAGITGVSPDDPPSLTIPGSAYWTFSNGIGQGNSSIGLAFCSANLPEMTPSLVVNGGGYAIPTPVATPSSVSIPEPGTLALLVTGLGMMAIWRRRRMKK